MKNVFDRLNTPPGTKLQLQGRIPVNIGFLLLSRSNARVLGGHVDKLVDNWELKRVGRFYLHGIYTLLFKMFDS